MRVLVRNAGAALLLGLMMAGCARSHETEDERIRRQAAEETREVRRDAQNAGVEARKAAEQARRQARDILAGVREGWQEGAPADKSAKAHMPVDLNTGSVAELDALPGVTAAEARSIVAHRPYHARHDLVRRKVLSGAEYERIKDAITVGP